MGSKRYATTRQLLDELLEGPMPFGAAELDAVKNELDEDDHLDFKSAKAPADKIKDLLWEYVTGFANATGGVLVVGVTDKRPRRIENVTASGKEDPATWAEKVLQTAAVRVAPPPRFLTVKKGKSRVLVAATAAAPQMIPLPGRELRYARRIGQSTLILPPDLVADLLIGRRAHPHFKVPGSTVHSAEGLPRDRSLIALRMSCDLENDSFVHARNVAIGVVVHSLSKGAGSLLSGFLRSQVDIQDPVGIVKTLPGEGPYGWTVLHTVGYEIPVIRPFSVTPLELGNPRPGSLCNIPQSYHSAYFRFAFYVLPEGSPPRWFQVDWEYVASYDSATNTVMLTGTPRVSEVVGGRPVVTWRER